MRVTELPVTANGRIFLIYYFRRPYGIQEFYIALIGLFLHLPQEPLLTEELIFTVMDGVMQELLRTGITVVFLHYKQ